MFRATSNILLTHACDGESGCLLTKSTIMSLMCISMKLQASLMRSGREICAGL
jgi:hypothetical protein